MFSKNITMASKTGQRGTYTCKIGFYDIYYTNISKKDEPFKISFSVYHAKKLKGDNFKTKEEAIEFSKNLLDKKQLKSYNL